MKLNCIIIDDEPLARIGIREYIQDIDFLTCSNEFQNPIEVSEYLLNNSVDLMFLDIHMPKLSGIDFLKKTESLPLVIFTTAFPDYALESYELNVIDYLIKPISFERFKKAAQKAFDYFSLKHPQPLPEYFFIKCNQQVEKIFFSEVLFVEAMQNYCVIHTLSRKLICYVTLTAMIAKLPIEKFLKVHKSFVVGLDKVTGIEGSSLKIGDFVIPISRSMRQLVTEKIIGGSLLKR